MALPSSPNQISLQDILFEKQHSNTARTNVSLKGLSVDGTDDYQGGDITGTPNGTAPYKISEFYSYTHDNSVWTLGNGGTETVSTQYSSAGNAAYMYAYDYQDSTSPASADTSITLSAKIVNSGNNTSTFSLVAYNDFALHRDINNGNIYKYNTSGTSSTFTYGTSQSQPFELYRAVWTGSTYSNFVPDTWNIDYTLSGGQVGSIVRGGGDFDTATSAPDESAGGGAYSGGQNFGSSSWNDNTDHTYNATTGTHTSERRFYCQAYTSGVLANGGLVKFDGYVTFNVTFKKSGKDDTAATGGGFKFRLRSTADTLGFSF